MRPHYLITIAALTTCCLLPGCIPYAVGTTPETVDPDEWVPSAVTYVIPNGFELLSGDSAQAASFFGVDNEFRFGISDDEDIGVRVPGLSGVVINYKRRFQEAPDTAELRRGLMLAVMPGIGLINFGEHAHFELSLLASSRHSATLTPYGGLRAMQVLPLSDIAVSDSPTLGGFFGVRIGTMTRGVSPEIGIYYDRSALNLRSSSIIFVPSVTVHGLSIADLFQGPRRPWF